MTKADGRRVVHIRCDSDEGHAWRVVSDDVRPQPRVYVIPYPGSHYRCPRCQQKLDDR